MPTNNGQTKYEIAGITNPSMTLQERMNAVAQYWKFQPKVKRPNYTPVKPLIDGCNCDGAGWFMKQVNNNEFQLVKCDCGIAGESFEVRQLSKELDVLSNRIFDNFSINRPYIDLPDVNAKTQRKMVEIAFHKASQFAQQPKGWLYIHGKPGTGKSHLAAAIANHNKHRMTVIYRSMPTLMDLIRENSNQLDTFINQISDAQMVIIDDIGADNKPTDWAEARIFTLINCRVDKPTVFTSNYDVSELPYREHILDRLNASRRCWLNTTSMRKGD